MTTGFCKPFLLPAGMIVVAIATHADAAELKFKKHHIDPTFISEGVAVGDVNRDGMPDILAGPYWYQAPSFNRHEIRKPGTYKAAGGYSKSFMNAAVDVNHDGWIDHVVVGFPGEPALWYENPKGKAGHWTERPFADSACNETPIFTDLTGDNVKEMLFAVTTPGEPKALGKMAWFAPPTATGATWSTHIISKDKSPGTHKFSHGLGVGDINGDGRKDVIITDGWWEAPDDRTRTDWTFHAEKLGPACANMHPYDVDGDGDADIVSSSAHNFGIWWHEQTKSENGRRQWRQHLISDRFSQTHALEMADMNGDGVMDFVTGKRYFAHNGHDPGGTEPAVLYWIELTRIDGWPRWTLHKIDDDSGIGTQLLVHDLNGDGRLDIIVSNKKGTFFHEQLAGGE